MGGELHSPLPPPDGEAGGLPPLVVLAILAVMLRQTAPARRNTASNSAAPGASRCAHRVCSESSRACVGLRRQNMTLLMSPPTNIELTHYSNHSASLLPHTGMD